MDRSVRDSLLEIDSADLDHATPEELDLYLSAMEIHAELMSPLHLAMACSDAKAFAHIELLNRWIMALMDGRLYWDGPGPAPVDSGDVDEDGYAIYVHPERGDRPVYNLAISMPPRHGKSYLVSEHLPAWFLANYPEYAVLLTSYNEQFASEWGEKVRNLLVENPRYGLQVDGGRQASKSNFGLTGHRGYMKCAGAGGTLTGKGGHLLICDDPIKNAEEAMSALERDNNDNWWRTTFYSRRQMWIDGTPARCVLMSTRWHEDDLHGRRCPNRPKAGDAWAQINLMAVFEPTDDEPVDALGREPGEPLCAKLFPRSEIQYIRKEMGEAWFQAMYQGHPSLEEGNIIKRPFNYYSVSDDAYYKLPTEVSGAFDYYAIDACYRFGVLDLAASTKTSADWTVMGIFDVTPSDPRNLILVGIERTRITTENHEQSVQEWYRKWKLKALHVENKTYGTNLIGRMQRARDAEGGFLIQGVSGDQQMLARVLPLQYEVRNGRVWFPESAEWLKAFESEITQFPNARYDDQVDVAAYAVQVYQTLPSHVVRSPDPKTMDDVVEAHRQELAKTNTKRRAIIPGIGRWR